ncbi:MAG: UDP-N-acetylglucosamine--N-acetylmuramyl-(pentapeptide) pyrophosphoryl-undecaprenol N-acetylglucosamine transferase [Fimbriimonas ginsengisoli]|uniref:UDP-N-acetylglucosamine--N-acetylmuramyl-(pentapeptide) pyrophosphoryl-undecaprenol N-acetylglucosamine transferase n=1 Tax=Fimbriimonas ginsengisoli TaxID=1005039 RepID=A0A931LTM2_FIMGI|nr:UDP-N-acetylglucosamine--N-acetylmuramyl-(pentapeptide) pyrophosphoryl-undecaprenol N-acetylglucosamine transferase [Fimbriimonas ginsengisoli]MBI3721725.1 UDP-N-acetylglucosamine--N-acetylmuramyl-(pentapeptide) pyrophosphoryl-undecaprenol N-acetylglucosamine transferase [Fimbriimonas ginsengisoli]
MFLAVTGGGTGGHVYPALEVARLARERGHELLYLGSLRGQEGPACEHEGISFVGFPSAPLASLRTLDGWRSLTALLRARAMAKTALRVDRPSVLFSTGGYSAAPVVSAARALSIPYGLFEANSVPGRSNSLYARQARAVATVFRGTEARFPGSRVVRTGLPIRREVRLAAQNRTEGTPTVFVVGGSQGSRFLNEAVPAAARALARPGLRWLHVAGRAHFHEVSERAEGIANYQVEPYLDGDAMANAYRSATVLVGRSGSILAEVALFGIPSVLVPLPTAAGDHQTENAQEFVAMGAAILHLQATSTPERLASDIAGWLDDAATRAAAGQALASFDVPDATDRILALLEEAAR